MSRERTGRWGAVSVILLGLSLAWGGCLCLAETPSKERANPFVASTSKAARDSALQSIPVEKLDAKARAKIAPVLASTSVFRRMPVHVIQCDPELYVFLVHHPDVVVNVWRVLGISPMVMEQTGPDSFKLSDGAGTRGTLEFLYRSQDTQVVYVDGSYSGPPFPKAIDGRGVLILRTGYVQETDGRHYITSRLDAFLSVEPGVVEWLTKTFQPFVGKVADMNFIQTTAFVGSLSRTAEVNRAGVQRLAGKLTHVQPEVRQQFAELSERVAKKAAEGRAADGRAAGGQAAERAEARGAGAPLMAQRTPIVDTPEGADKPQSAVRPASAVTSGRETSPGPTP